MLGLAYHDKVRVDKQSNPYHDDVYFDQQFNVDANREGMQMVRGKNAAVAEGTSEEMASEGTPAKRTRVVQSDVPRYSLEQAIRVPRAIAQEYAGKPTKPVYVANAMGVTHASSQFRMLCGAATAYGLTDGGYNSPAISITPLGKRIVRPLKEGEDFGAKRESFLKPRIIAEFLRQYNNNPIPRNHIARNVLMEMGVAPERTQEVLDLIIKTGESIGVITSSGSSKVVDLEGIPTRQPVVNGDDELPFDQTEEVGEIDEVGNDTALAPLKQTGLISLKGGGGNGGGVTSNTNPRRVFITHGKNQAFVELIKRMLTFGELEPVVATQHESVSQAVPDKVMNDMRGCGAAIIHVDDEQRLMDTNAKEHVVLNPNVLIEIGAAMALYGQRFILLVKEGVQLPSNLQGLYQVRYSGDMLDGNATMKLFEAIGDIKNHPLPSGPDGN
jgi:hypothetical protein